MVRNNKGKIIRSTKNLIILTILTTIIATFFSLSKYQSSIAGTAETKVALMANNTKTDLTDIKGKPRRYFFI